MEASEIIGLFRQQVDDAIEPYHLSTADALLFLAEAEEEAAIRAHLIRATGAARSLFAVAANQSTVKLDARVYWVEDAQFQLTAGGRPWGLEAKGMDWVEDQSAEGARIQEAAGSLFAGSGHLFREEVTMSGVIPRRLEASVLKAVVL